MHILNTRRGFRSLCDARVAGRFSPRAILILYARVCCWTDVCRTVVDSICVSRRNPSVRRLQSAHRGPLHPQSAGPPVAQQVPEMQRLPGAAGGQVLQQGRQRLLQRGFLQVSAALTKYPGKYSFTFLILHLPFIYFIIKSFLCFFKINLLMATFWSSKKEIRDQVRSVSAGDSAHTGGEEGAGLRLPPALLRLHRVQEAAGHRWRVLPDGGQQAGVQGRLRDRQTERWAACGQFKWLVYCTKTKTKKHTHKKMSSSICIYDLLLWVWRDNEVIHNLWPTCPNCVVARNPIDSKLRKVEARRPTPCTGVDPLPITLIIGPE